MVLDLLEGSEFGREEALAVLGEVRSTILSKASPDGAQAAEQRVQQLRSAVELEDSYLAHRPESHPTHNDQAKRVFEAEVARARNDEWTSRALSEVEQAERLLRENHPGAYEHLLNTRAKVGLLERMANEFIEEADPTKRKG
jgi:hypothetical protein